MMDRRPRKSWVPPSTPGNMEITDEEWDEEETSEDVDEGGEEEEDMWDEEWREQQEQEQYAYEKQEEEEEEEEEEQVVVDQQEGVVHDEEEESEEGVVHLEEEEPETLFRLEYAVLESDRGGHPAEGWVAECAWQLTKLKGDDDRAHGEANCGKLGGTPLHEYDQLLGPLL
eukprot:TRINITY_DN11827_c0_g1_i1.p1 TRINITY_DN11827_c0_g1~~TRINITY_DN11827_c0_g1_i1.p1  ORF type:complete len:171 (+),score=63.09 TRINITY_DN11827_c0_g1_i1:269-781(+)